MLTDDNNSWISEDEYLNLPALSSDTEPDSDSDNDDDSSDNDDDDVPWTNNLSSNISRGEQEVPPGCPGMVPEDEDPVDIDSAEHQEALQRAFNEIAEVLEAQEKERVAKSQGESKKEEESSMYAQSADYKVRSMRTSTRKMTRLSSSVLNQRRTQSQFSKI